MRGVDFGRSRPGRRLADHRASPELVAREGHLDSGREPVPHVSLDTLAVEEDVCCEDLAAEQVVHDERGDVALAGAGIFRGPVVLRIGGVQAPGLANGLFELRQREGQGGC